MTDLLKKAFDAAQNLPDEKQDAFAKFLLEELESEQRWTEQFEASPGLLAALAEEGLDEHRAGATEELHPDRL